MVLARCVQERKRERTNAKMTLKVCFTLDAMNRVGGQQYPISGTESHVCHVFPQACSPNCQEVLRTDW